MKEKKKKKGQWQQWLFMGFFVLIGAVCGVLMARFADQNVTENSSLIEELLPLMVLFVGMYVGIYLQLIIHEAGHLVFGLLSGYRFTSFRIGSFMWMKENNKIAIKRLTLAGTGGQCLMEPPQMQDGKIPVILFNLGYLPGGNHTLATKESTTLEAARKGLTILKKQGVMCICIYSGGDSGFSEKEAVLLWAQNLPAKEYDVISCPFINKPNNPPLPVFIRKR